MKPTQEQVLQLAHETFRRQGDGFAAIDAEVMRFFTLAYEAGRKDEREKVAYWMIQRSYATGHGDATEDLLAELEWQVREAEQEPCIHVNNPKGCYRVRCQLGNKCVNDDMSFRTTPPQREWQGLTDEEIENCFEMSMFGTCRAIEAKLKEKNGF